METWLIIMAVPSVALAVLAVVVWILAHRAERRHPPRGKFIEVEGVRLHYIEQGEGEPLVLIHGNGSLIDDFLTSGLVDLAARRFRVIAFDRPGFGHSTRPRRQYWTPERQAALLRGAFTRLGIVKPVVVGHSWGTLVTLALALRRPEEVRGIVLMAGYYFATPRLDVALLSAPAVPVLGDILRYTISPLLSWLMLDKILGRMFEPQPIPSRFRAGFPASLTLRPWQLRAAAEETALMLPSAAEMSRSYAQLQVQAVIVVGSGDHIVDPEQQSARLHQEIAGSSYVVVPDAGHMVHHRDPARVFQAVVAVAETRHDEPHARPRRNLGQGSILGRS